MAYASPMKIANGLVLDFTVDNADTAADTFLGLNASGEVTKFASVPRARVSGGGNITEATSSVLSITGGTAAVLTSGLTIQVLQAGAAQSGYLSTTDWNTFNNKLGTSLTSAYIYVGNGSNVATAVAMSGDISITNTGNAQIVAGAIIDADVNASAAIAFSKMASLTASRILASNGSGVVSILDTATYPSLTELAYVKEVTSAIQTQLNNRLSVTLTSPTNGDVITYNGAAWVNSPSSTGVPTAGTTAQILRKIDNTNYNTEWHTLVAADITDVSSTAAELNKLSGVTTTATQFNFLNTLSGDVQAQLAAKVGTSLTQNYMFVGDASNVVSTLAPGTNGYVLTSVSGVPTWVSPGVGGTVTSVAASGGTTGMSFTGSPITTSGTLTLTGTLAIANGGIGLTALGTALQSLRVNAGATALEYFTPSTDFADNAFRVSDNSDSTKKLAFELSSVTASTTRTLTVPDASGIIALTSDIITPALDNLYGASGNYIMENNDANVVWDWSTLDGTTGFTFRSTSTAAATNTLRVMSVQKSGANTNVNQTTTSLNILNIATGLGSTNVGINISVSGGSTDNVAIRSTAGNWQMQGSGSTFTLGGGATASQLRFLEPSGSGANYIGFKAPALAGDTVYDLPNAFPVVSGYVLSSTTAGVMSWIAASGGIGGSTGSVDNAILRADGTGGSTAQASSLFIDDSANLTLGTASLAGANRLITINSSVGNADLMLEGLGTGYVYVTGGRFAVNNSRTSLYTNISINSTTSLMRIFGTYWNSSATAQVFEILGADGISGINTGQNLYLRSGNGYNSGNTNGGHTYLDTGVGNGSGLKGNIGLFESNVANWQGMSGGIKIQNVIIAPSAGLADGVGFYAKDVASSSELFVYTESGAEMNISGLLTPVTESGTTITLTEAHRGRLVLCTNSGVVTVTVGTSLPDGWNCILLATNATGTITLSAGGATLNGTTSTTTQFESLTLINYGSDTYICKLG